MGYRRTDTPEPAAVLIYDEHADGPVARAAGVRFVARLDAREQIAYLPFELASRQSQLLRRAESRPRITARTIASTSALISSRRRRRLAGRAVAHGVDQVLEHRWGRKSPVRLKITSTLLRVLHLSPLDGSPAWTWRSRSA